ncbi:glycosyltransferase [Candidatus Microgenomates bacterium]|nr:glycosyltransferase [Candidatus Microgenomates bacterium]
MISVIIPFYNESENLAELITRLTRVFGEIKERYELVLVDDGSTDDYEKKLPKKSAEIHLVKHRRKLGKGRALETGFSKSKGDIIVFMDADLQDDPDDLPKFIEKLNAGYDFVNGWRRDRIDPISKTLPSSIFNYFLLKKMLKSTFHDINCGFKAMRRELLEEFVFYGDNYRFLPILVNKKGYKTTEVVVTHHARMHGVSKYGFFRIFFGFFDTVTTYFIYSFAEKPLHFFGPVGGVFFLVGLVITLWLTVERLFFDVELYKRPLLLAGIFLMIVGLQVIMTGILGELAVYLHKNKERVQ